MAAVQLNPQSLRARTDAQMGIVNRIPMVVNQEIYHFSRWIVMILYPPVAVGITVMTIISVRRWYSLRTSLESEGKLIYGTELASIIVLGLSFFGMIGNIMAIRSQRETSAKKTRVACDTICKRTLMINIPLLAIPICGAIGVIVVAATFVPRKCSDDKFAPCGWIAGAWALDMGQTILLAAMLYVNIRWYRLFRNPTFEMIDGHDDQGSSAIEMDTHSTMSMEPLPLYRPHQANERADNNQHNKKTWD